MLTAFALTFAILSKCAGAYKCDYGNSPGRFVPGTLPTWHLFNTSCTLKDEISRYQERSDSADVGIVPEDTQAQNSRPVGILMFGDSMEQSMVRFACEAILGEKLEELRMKDHAKDPDFCGKELHWRCDGCSSGAFAIAREPMHGVLKTRDFERDASTPLPERFEAAFEDFARRRGRSADIIAFGLNFWDVTTIKDHDHSVNYILDATMKQWLAKCEALFERVQIAAHKHGSIVFVRTYALPPLNFCQAPESKLIPASWLSDVSARAIIVQLNSAGRHMAQRFGFMVADLEAMALSFGHPDDFFKDGHHPKDEFLKEVLNIYMNTWRSTLT